MTPRILTRLTVAAAALGAVALVPTIAPGEAGHAAAAKKITPKGVGQVKLGKRFSELRAAGLVGRKRPGCELGGADQRFARLKDPLKGTVDLTLASPREVKRVTVRGGAKARGVGVGATVADIKTAFPKAKVDHNTEQVFGITLVKIPKDGGGRIQFAVDVNTKKTTLIGVPNIAFCE